MMGDCSSDVALELVATVVVTIHLNCYLSSYQ